MSTTADVAQSEWVGARRTPLLLVLAVLMAGALPADAQQAAPTPEPPHRAAASRREARIPDDADQRGFWQRLRDEARRVRRLDGGPVVFAMRFRISPQLAHTIQDAALAQGLDPELGFRLVRAESNFNPRARSHAGALGYTQLMPYTARWLDRGMTTPERIMQPEANLAAGFRYLRRLIDKYGDVRLALLAYNRGEGAVDRDLARGRNPENGYTRRVLGTGMDRYRGSGRREEEVR
ncbi:lytic transglycosylase domain-containing protein [Longimicrobium sp.]|uniref:lytic transglycosylase domain-containing protein n=1 Tax=Longimicrobium sp. TaxID=2029185 RepID=UPI002E332917|nr:lytic transglycosylase domain-containing protein [Longimicrobium sp.]HEX6038283.1 lytic transglycosylase domain-containing protein [Longimicrobium sp.]